MDHDGLLHHGREPGPTLGVGRHRWRDDSLVFLSVGALVVLSRIPFLGPGYGLQPDAWRVAVTAHAIATTGEYSASRFPGNPVQEIVCSLLWTGGPWVLNGLTALFSGIASAFFALSMRALGRNGHMIASLALALIPIVYSYSTMSLDSVWALAFILSGLYLVLVRRPVLAGAALGIAIGCRLTSGAMLIPMGLLLARGQPRQGALRHTLWFSVVASVIGAAAFAPALAKYGWGSFSFHETGYPPWRDVVQQATLDMWGSLGFVGLLAAVVSLAFKPTTFRTIRFRPLSDAGLQVIAWVLAIALYVIAYLRLPHQAKYLIPMLPFVILLLDRILDRRVFIVVCSMFIASPFLTIGRTGMHAGPIFSEHSARRGDMEFVERVISRVNDLPERAVVVVGAWLPKIQGVLLGQPQGMAEYVYALNASDLESRLAQGAVYYLPEIREYNRRLAGIDLADFGAGPLPAERQ